MSDYDKNVDEPVNYLKIQSFRLRRVKKMLILMNVNG